jgi:hypothetical protein
MVRAMVPNLVGAYWTFPAQSRRLERLDESIRQLLRSITDVVLVGQSGTAELAIAASESIGAFARLRVPAKKAEIEPIRAEMAPILETVGIRLKDFRVEARRDLGYENRRRFLASRGDKS